MAIGRVDVMRGGWRVLVLQRGSRVETVVDGKVETRLYGEVEDNLYIRPAPPQRLNAGSYPPLFAAPRESLVVVVDDG